MTKRKTDPVLGKLLDEQEKAIADFERWYARLKRTWNRLDKVKGQLVRLARKIKAHKAAQS
jgi:hypothetical protein